MASVAAEITKVYIRNKAAKDALMPGSAGVNSKHEAPPTLGALSPEVISSLPTPIGGLPAFRLLLLEIG